MKSACAASMTLLLALALAHPAGAVQVTGLSAQFHAGQSYLTWNSPPPATGNAFRVYRRTTPPAPGDGPSTYEYLGSVKDSSACDRRFSTLRKAIFAYVIPGVGLLDAGGGLFVHTVDAAGSAYYAVTFQPAGGSEDTTLVPGTNATTAPVIEWIDKPAVTFQRTASVGIGQFTLVGSVYTLWTSNRSTPVFPAMAPNPSTPFDCSITLNGPGQVTTRSLMFTPHARGGDFMNLNWGSQTYGEYVLLLDDHIPHWNANTFWFGHHRGYSYVGPDVIPTAGIVEDYTLRRIRYTVEWARQALEVDTTQVYACGGSMGGIGTVLALMHMPDLFAAGMAWLPVFDFSAVDPDPNSSFSEIGLQRYTTNLLWGRVETGLLMSDGRSAYDLLNAKWMVEQRAAQFVPPLVAVAGRRDVSVGWTEKPSFFATMTAQRAGGVFFFDPRNHSGTGNAQWSPMERPEYVYRFRTNRSFPAFSNCSTDQDPGNGDPNDGDSVGTINGPLDWDPIPQETASTWSTRLFTRALDGRFQSWPAPESLTVDVTPRRAQQFLLQPFQPVSYSVQRQSNGAIVQTGTVSANEYGIVTAPNVRTYRTGTWLFLTALAPLGVGSSPRAPRLQTAIPNPLVHPRDVEVQWPAAGAGRAELFDVGGRRVAHLFDGSVSPGLSRFRLDPRPLGAGVYFLRVTDGRDALVRRIVIAR